jgi:hypothetical protein
MKLLRSMIFTGLYFLNSCSGTSLNSVFLTDDELSTNEQLSESKQYYDEGKFDKAEALALKVYNSNINKENASILLSYISLSQAGFDPFALSKNIMSSSEDDESIDTDSGTSDGLLSMSKILNLKDADYLAMSASEEQLGEYKVYIPNNNLEVIRANPELAIFYVNKAISYICPYMDTEVKLDGELGVDLDSRHITSECNKDEAITSIKGHFAWSLAHLAEALVFYSLTMYSSQGIKPNVTLYSENIQNEPPSDFVQSIGTLSTVIENVFPDTNGETMSGALFNDLETVNGTISYMGNALPSSLRNGLKKVTASISKSLEKIQDISSGASASGEMKNALTQGISKQLSKAIEGKGLTGSQLSDACTALEGINGSATLPSSCGS